MNTILMVLKNDLWRCEFSDNEEFENSIDITDGADDFPFANVTLNLTTGKYDVCRVVFSLEYGNEVRDDAVEARDCTVQAASAVCRRLHEQRYPQRYPFFDLDEGKRRQTGHATVVPDYRGLVERAIRGDSA